VIELKIFLTDKGKKDTKVKLKKHSNRQRKRQTGEAKSVLTDIKQIQTEL
jgi:hypothetical protein